MERKINILQVVHNFPPYGYSGTEIYTLDLSKELERLGHNVTVLFPIPFQKDADYEILSGEYEGIKTICIKMPPPSSLIESIHNERTAYRFREILNKNHFDVVHFQHLLYLTPSLIEVARKMHLPTILTLHDLYLLCREINPINSNGAICQGPESVDKCVQCYLRVNKRENLPPKEMASLYYYKSYRFEYFKSILQLIDVILSPTLFIKNSFERFGFAQGRIRILPFGIKPFQPIQRRPDDKITFTFLGNLRKVKGIDILIEAFNSVAKEAQLNIYGTSHDHLLLQRIIQHTENNPKIHYRGPYRPEDLPEIFSQTDLTVVPSLWENYPLVVRESFQARVPVIGSAVGGIPEMVGDGENGLLFKPGDSLDLYSKMKMVLEDPTLIDRLRAKIKPVKTIQQEAIELQGMYL